MQFLKIGIKKHRFGKIWVISHVWSRIGFFPNKHSLVYLKAFTATSPITVLLLQQQAFRAISYFEYQIISKPWACKPPLLMSWPALDKGNLLQQSSASTRESENCWPRLWLPWIRCGNSGYSQLCFCDTANSFDQRLPSHSQCSIWIS